MRNERDGSSQRIHRRTRTFASLTGPANNIGDAVIRRRTLEWALKTSDELIVYTGAAPDVWLRQLKIPDGAVILRTKRSVPRWLWMLATSAARPVLMFEAGEVPLDRGNVLRELVFLAETVLVRLKGGVVVRPPRGIRAPTNPALWLHALAARLSQVALWRDTASAELAGGDALAPDIGFAADPQTSEQDREELIVSLRGGRTFPGSKWVEAIRAIADQEGLRIRAVVQVRDDELRARELAEALGGEFEPWGDIDPVVQEAKLRERYTGARLVISDRMHVLVLAAIDGAMPAELVPSPTGKIANAFATIGVAGISCDANACGVDEMIGFLEARLSDSEIGERVSSARERLAALEREMRETILAARA